MHISRHPIVFPTRFDFEKRIAHLHEMTRETYSQSVFLDHRIVTAGEKTVAMAEDDFIREVGALHRAQRGPHFIFHVAFCGSTLLCRCLDRPGRCLPYKEPLILHQLSFLARRQTTEHRHLGRGQSLLAASLRLLGRTFGESEVAVVKPSDSCANLARDMLRRANGAAGLFLYRQLRPFLLSVLKTNDRRAYVRGMAERARSDLARLDLYPRIDFETLTDGRLAALVWSSLVFTFSDVLRDAEISARSLDSDVLFNYPRKTIAAAARLFELNLSEDEITAILEEGILSKDAKSPDHAFDRKRHKVNTEDARRRLATEVSDAVAWLSEVMGDVALPTILPRPLPT